MVAAGMAGVLPGGLSLGLAQCLPLDGKNGL